MSITCCCPLRISLVGGSTDNPLFLEKYKSGRVISFPCDLKTYVTIHRDVFGSNTLLSNYVLNYSSREEVNNIHEIKNELIRYCFDELNVESLNLFFTSDVFSNGSGLASSSAYLMALIKSIYTLRDQSITDSEVCKLANKIEKNFNPLVGQQDFYGSMGGLKKMKFYEDKNPEITYLDTRIFEQMDMFLIYTGVVRKSTELLKSLDLESCLPLLKDVDDLEYSIINNDFDLFHEVINRTWINKKNSSKLICQDEHIKNLDSDLIYDQNVLSHKLLGAGNGGYFLIFTNPNMENYIHNKYKFVKQIKISDKGLQISKI